MVRIFYAGRLYDIAYSDIVRTCHLTTFAIKAILQCLIIEKWFFQAVALSIGTRLFRPRIIRIDRSHGAVDGADGAFDA